MIIIENELFGRTLFWSVPGAIIGTIITVKKGKGWFVGFLCGIVFGPLVALILLLGGTDRKRLGLKKCPFCAEWIKRQAAVCKHCHRDQVPPQPAV